MKKNIISKYLIFLLGILLSVALFLLPVVNIPMLDTKADSYFKDTIEKAIVAYGTCRAANASLSIIKGSNLQLEPGGVGISLAIGQIVDPIDDMTKRLSDVLVTAITSLGLQKLSHKICMSITQKIASLLLIIGSFLVLIDHEKLPNIRRIICKFLILISILRFCLPLSSYANDVIYNSFFSDKISQSNNELKNNSAKFSQVQDLNMPESNGIIGTVGNSGIFIKNKSIAFKNAINDSLSNMGSTINHLLDLTLLYAGILMIQVIILPLTVFFVLMKISNAIFMPRIPSELKNNN